jgi:dihydroorotate dehydrogenase (fumarate)
MTPDLSTTYLGLKLKSPIIVGSSGLTDKPEKIAQLEKFGAGAVVLKSIFEEEITMEYEHMLKDEEPKRYKDDYLDYFDYRIKEVNIENYLNLIINARKQAGIPIIASINCNTSKEWTYYAKKIEEAGADALELNIFILPSVMARSAENIESTYIDIIQSVRNQVKLPLAVKMSYYFSNLAGMIAQLSRLNIGGLVLFNRTYSPDIDTERMEITSTNVLSSPRDLSISLRWIAIMANRVKCDLAASTGVHDGQAVIKQLLAGATAVQVVSALYDNGMEYLEKMLDEVKEWMAYKNFDRIDRFRGLLSQEKQVDPALFERVQFMKYFSDRDKNLVR